MFVALRPMRAHIGGELKSFSRGEVIPEEAIPNPRAALRAGFVVMQDDTVFLPRSLRRFRYNQRRDVLLAQYPNSFDLDYIAPVVEEIKPGPKPAPKPVPVEVVAPEPVVMVEEDTPVISEPEAIEPEAIEEEPEAIEPEPEPEAIEPEPEPEPEEEPEPEPEPEPEAPAKFVLLRADVDNMKRPELVAQANELGAADSGKNARKAEALEFLEEFIED